LGNFTNFFLLKALVHNQGWMGFVFCFFLGKACGMKCGAILRTAWGMLENLGNAGWHHWEHTGNTKIKGFEKQNP
jgi:hypothetical protein